MSCGSKTCTSIEVPRNIETTERPSALWRVWRAIESAIHKARLHQFRLELEKARQRGLLKHLDEHQLEDIGLTREQADREARKPFWK